MKHSRQMSLTSENILMHKCKEKLKTQLLSTSSLANSIDRKDYDFKIQFNFLRIFIYYDLQLSKLF